MGFIIFLAVLALACLVLAVASAKEAPAIGVMLFLLACVTAFITGTAIQDYRNNESVMPGLQNRAAEVADCYEREAARQQCCDWCVEQKVPGSAHNTNLYAWDHNTKLCTCSHGKFFTYSGNRETKTRCERLMEQYPR